MRVVEVGFARSKELVEVFAESVVQVSDVIVRVGSVVEVGVDCSGSIASGIVSLS